MIVKNLSDLEKTERDVFWGNGQSRRFLIENDGMPFSLTDTIVNAGSVSLLQYRNHFEACYCIEGEGEVECKDKIFIILPGTMYAVNKHDKHYLRAKTDMRLICVFSPPLKGTETHKVNLNKNESSTY